MSGTCFAKCVSHILNLPVEGMPEHDVDVRTWRKAWAEYLRPFGLSLAWLDANHPAPEGTAILTLETLKGTSHAVVMQDNLMVFDPNPENERHAYAIKLHWYVLYVLNPREMIR